MIWLIGWLVGTFLPLLTEMRWDIGSDGISDEDEIFWIGLSYLWACGGAGHLVCHERMEIVKVPRRGSTFSIFVLGT